MRAEEEIKPIVNATYSDEWQGNEDLTTAHNKAIKALEQEPCEDCVSRQTVNKWIDNDTYLTKTTKCRLEEELQNLPSVAPTRKKGKWIFTKTIFDKHGCTVECSWCHKKWKTYDEIHWKKENKYCPNCGSLMSKEV